VSHDTNIWCFNLTVSRWIWYVCWLPNPTRNQTIISNRLSEPVKERVEHATFSWYNFYVPRNRYKVTAAQSQKISSTTTTATTMIIDRPFVGTTTFLFRPHATTALLPAGGFFALCNHCSSICRYALNFVELGSDQKRQLWNDGTPAATRRSFGGGSCSSW